MFLTYKYRLLTKRGHRRAFERAREMSRILYNAALQERIDAWRKARISISKYEQYKSLTEIRGDDDLGVGQYPAVLTRWPLERVDEAFKGFFSRIKSRNGKAGFPRFRLSSRWTSFGFTEWSGIKLEGNRLSIKGVVSRVRVAMHRPIPDGAEFCSAVITEQHGVWYLCLALKPKEATPVERTADNTAGADWGLENALTLDDGRVFATVAPNKELKDELRRRQRTLARCGRRSNNRKKAVRAVARIKRREADTRLTMLHQMAAEIVKTTPFIAIEDLAVKNMTASAAGTTDAPGKNVKQKSGLNRSILDGAPALLMNYLSYKAERAGGEARKVNPRRTSMECAMCGAVEKKTLAQRIHSCAHCGFTTSRDRNSSFVIRQRGFGDRSPYLDGLKDCPE